MTTMPTVHVLTGYPASGKSTHARELVARAQGRMHRVNLDDIRAMLGHAPGHDPAWTWRHEATAKRIQEDAIRAAVRGGFDIVVDNTHLTPRMPGRIKGIVAGEADFVVHDFTHVTVAECIKRDIDRPNSVGEDVIRMLADRHRKATRSGWRLTTEWMNDEPVHAPYTPADGTPHAVMCDIDGTLALLGDRGPYDFDRCGMDALNESVAYALDAFAALGNYVILLSGRGEEFRPQTEEWLARHQVSYDQLHMRAAGDRRRDDIVKAELFDTHVRQQFNVRMSFDDRDRVVGLWRRLGLPTWQVNYGDF